MPPLTHVPFCMPVKYPLPEDQEMAELHPKADMGQGSDPKKAGGHGFVTKQEFSKCGHCDRKFLFIVDSMDILTILVVILLFLFLRNV